MAISTLSKMTVPLASGDSQATQVPVVKKKTTISFRVSLENFGVIQHPQQN